jgi:hypothetical protein
MAGRSCPDRGVRADPRHDQRACARHPVRTRLDTDVANHLSKDRVPREAAVAGSIVVLRSAETVKYFLSHPPSADCLFTDDDVASGALYYTATAMLGIPTVTLPGSACTATGFIWSADVSTMRFARSSLSARRVHWLV